jgi:hypothetical protein
MNIINLLIAIAASIFGGDPAATTSTNCSGFVITVADGADVGCNVVAGQRLDVTGVGFDHCMDMGGIWLPDSKGTCQGVDF